MTYQDDSLEIVTIQCDFNLNSLYLFVFLETFLVPTNVLLHWLLEFFKVNRC